MLDLSNFAAPLRASDPRVQPAPDGFPAPIAWAHPGTRWWLVNDDVECDEVLPRLLTAMHAGGWRKVAAEKMSIMLEGPGGRVVVHVDDAPCRDIVRRTAGGKEFRRPLWPGVFDGRVILAVETI